MNELQKFEYITQWYADNISEEVSKLKEQENIDEISQIESIIGESIPSEIREVFMKYNGEDNIGHGTFIGHSLVSLEEVVQDLDYSRSNIKPENPYISHPEKSKEIIDAVNNIYRSTVPKKNRWSLFKKKWHKLFYVGSANSRQGPYFYKDKNTSDKEREILRLSEEQGKQVQRLFRELQELEQKSYNWDEVSCTLYGDDSYSFERTFYNFNDGLSSFPDRCIKLFDFHFGWLPVIKDHGGNFIGIDFDPDENGTKGQVIVYGRDEKLMFVLANSWAEFLELVLNTIHEKPSELLESRHLHDYFKGFIVKT